MSLEAPASSATIVSAGSTRPAPTRVRYWLLGIATANAFLLYLDRICMTAVVDSNSFHREFALNPAQLGDIKSAFFLAYAIGQPFAGWMADRFGPRRTLVVYIALWSLCTALTGVAGGLAALLAARLACGLAESGAYPASARIVSRWFPLSQRARASSAVAFGGRVGGAVALGLTAWFIVQLPSWRPALYTYGGIGIILAALTWIIFRDTPEEHPQVNSAELGLIRAESLPPPATRYTFPWKAIISHPGLWLLSLSGIGMNLGWAFLVTNLPEYLQTVHHLSPVDASWYSSGALFLGMFGMLVGGWWCDALTRWFGVTWGRRLPFLIGGGLAALVYLTFPFLPSAWAVMIACALVAFLADSIVPAVWAVDQDIGRQHVAATLAWTNMWGNFGASLTPKLIPFVLAKTPDWSDWRAVFWASAGGFVICGVCALFVDGKKQLRETV
jgi:ACS family glucarate transporter-like MFS transporter